MYDGSSRHSANLVQRAGSLFEWLYFKGQFKAIIARFTGQSRTIRYLDSAVSDMEDVEVEKLGVHPIRVEKIVGTQGRMNYDIDFNPLQRRDKKRWMSVAIAMMSDVTLLGPIHVVQVEDAFYTSDGNHRVSVARALDKLYMDADITRWILPDKTGKPEQSELVH